MTFLATPTGPFDLAVANSYFGGWLTVEGDRTVLMAFPVDGQPAPPLPSASTRTPPAPCTGTCR